MGGKKRKKQTKKIKKAATPALPENMRERFFLAVTIVVGGLVLWSPYFRGLTFDYERFVFLGVLFATGMIFFLYSVLYEREKMTPDTLPELAFLAFIVLYFINLPFSADRWLAWREAIGYLAAFFLFLLAFRISEGKERTKAILFAFAANAVILSLLGFFYRFGWISPDIRPLGMSMRDLFIGNRFHSNLQYPNTAAAYVGFGYFCALVVSLLKGNTFVRAVSLSFAFILLGGFFFTYSRGGLLTVPLAVVVFFLFLPRTQGVRLAGRVLVTVAVFALAAVFLERALRTENASSFFLFLMGGGALCGVLGYGLFRWEERATQSTQSRIFSPRLALSLLAVCILVLVLVAFAYPDAFARLRGISLEERNVSARLLFTRDAWGIIAGRPLTGWGGGAWEAMYLGYRSEPYSTISTHNYFSQVLTEAGFLGLFLLIVFLGSLMWGAYRIKEKVGTEGGVIAAGCIAAVFLGFLHSLVDVNFTLWAFQAALWLFAGITLGYVKREGGLSRMVKKNWPSREIFVLVGLVFLVISVLSFSGVRHTRWGDTYARRGEWENALYFYRIAAGRSFWNPDIHFKMSQAQRELFHLEGNPAYRTLSLENATQAVTLSSFSPAYRQHLGVLYVEMGQFERGIGYLEEAVRLSPLSPSYYENLMMTCLTVGDFYREQGDESAAFDSYRRGLAARDLFEENTDGASRAVRSGDIESLVVELEERLE